jgi:lysophospholipase L1-like esterase
MKASFSLIVFTLAALAPAAQPQDTSVHRENIEWCDSWMPGMNDHDLPRVVLIGDSITRGYFQEVEQNLKGKAYVARIATSKAIGDPALLTELATFLSQTRFDVVHFNIGMHGWAYSEEEYRQHFPALVSAIRKSAPGAKLAWASTTPIRKDREPGPNNDRIIVRNAIAWEYAVSQRIPIDDLHALMAPHDDLHSDDVHFNKEGSALLAGQVASEILKLLR